MAAPRADQVRQSRSGESAARAPRRPGRGAKRVVMDYLLELPRFLRLLWGLMTDARVSGFDKLLVAGAIAYIATPVDLVPDFVPFLGQVDDVYLLVVSLRRLIRNAGRAVLMRHWTGDPERLHDLSLKNVLVAAAFFLPRRRKKRVTSDQ